VRTWSTTLSIQWESRRIKDVNAVVKFGIMPDAWPEVEAAVAVVPRERATLSSVINDIAVMHEKR